MSSEADSKGSAEAEVRLGVRRWGPIDVEGDWRTAVQAISEKEGFTTIAAEESPEPALSPEHKHGGDEVRLMLSGSAYFQARVGETDEILTIHFGKGDMISMPAGVWHKLGPGEGGYNSVRFFHDKASWSKTMRE